jgi:beta-glucanase (GH16 family)
MLVHLRRSSVFCMFILALLPGGNAGAAGWVLNWQADFTQPLNSATKDWNIYNNGPINSSGCFMANNVTVSNLVLHLAANTTPNGCNRPYSVAGIDTWYHHTQTYGLWEVRAKFPAGYGVDGFIGLFAEDGSSLPEIDFGEAIGRVPSMIVLTEHYGTSSAPLSMSVAYTKPGVTWSAGFHTIELAWVPGMLYYYVDWVLVLKQPQLFTPPTAGMKLGIGIVAGDCGSWNDCPANAASHGFPTPLPTDLEISLVRIYTFQP